MDYLKKRTLIFIIAAVLLGSLSYGFLNRQTDNVADSIEKNMDNSQETSSNDNSKDILQEIDELNDYEEKGKKDESVSTMIFVDIDGAVNSPGTFQLPEGTRLCTLIEMAGGLMENADTRFINRAEKLHDEQKVYIPEEGDDIDLTSLDSKEVSDDSLNFDDGLIDINNANRSELESLPGIGEVIAVRIIDYRENTKCFSCIEDIMKVSGIADGKFNLIKDLIKVK